MTTRVGIIGYPLGHSVSPAFQQAAFDSLGLDVRYEVWATPPDGLAERMGALRSQDVLGANVTVPYKEDVLPYLDELDGAAKRIGAVNTIVHRGGRLLGYNTDAEGFLRALAEVGFSPRGKQAIILGAGGSARAVGDALASAGAAGLLLLNRTVSRATEVAEALSARGVLVEVRRWPPGAREESPRSPDLLVNCTPYGMKGGDLDGQAPNVAGLIAPSTLVYDLVYNPPETPLIRLAKKQGARTLGGLAMLVHQGAAAFRLWTGKEAPVDVMFRAARAALGTEGERHVPLPDRR